jgi:hypothetical protein
MKCFYAKKRIIRRDCYSRDKILLYSETEEYEGNISKEFLTNQEGKILKYINEYKDNRLIKRITPANDIKLQGTQDNITGLSKEKTKIFIYDMTGNLLAVENYTEDEFKDKFILVYIRK